MPPTLPAFEKRRDRPSVVATAAGHQHRLVYLYDRHSGQQFLVDTGAGISVLPPFGTGTRSENIGPPLTAANNSNIRN